MDSMNVGCRGTVDTNPRHEVIFPTDFQTIITSIVLGGNVTCFVWALEPEASTVAVYCPDLSPENVMVTLGLLDVRTSELVATVLGPAVTSMSTTAVLGVAS